MRTVLGFLFCVTLFASSAHAADAKKLIDMTYPFAEDTLHWPTAKPFHLEKTSEGRTAAGYWYSAYEYSGAEHVGTHLDAPFHLPRVSGPPTRFLWPGQSVPVSSSMCAARSAPIAIID